MGIIEGFRSKLRQQTKANRKISNRHGLIKLRDPLLQSHIDYRYPHTAGIRGSALRNDKNVVKDGIEVGKELIIYRGISKKGVGKKLLN